VGSINRKSQDAVNNGQLDRERYVIPPHLHDLQEAELPESQRGLVISEIAQFREKAAIRERDRSREIRNQIPNYAPSGPRGNGAPTREWGRPQAQNSSDSGRAVGSGPQGYDKPVGFVKGKDEGGTDRSTSETRGKTDFELEEERKEQRRKDEENSFRDVRVITTLSLRRFQQDDSVSVDTSLGSEPVCRLWSVPLCGNVRSKRLRLATEKR
jgi:RNA-binding protein 25